jgi:kumamolisin
MGLSMAAMLCQWKVSGKSGTVFFANLLQKAALRGLEKDRVVAARRRRSMSTKQRISLSGSEQHSLAGAELIQAVSNDDLIRVTVVLRRRSDAKPSATAGKPGEQRFASRTQYAAIHGADADDIAAIEKFAHEHGLTVMERHPESRRMVLSGPASAIQEAFGVTLSHYGDRTGGPRYRSYSGPIQLPAEIQPAVMAVLGLDDRPIAKPHFRICDKKKKKPAAPASFSAVQLAQLYHFPAGVTGAGQTIAILELGGGYSATDLNTYFSGLNLQTPSVTAVSVDNGQNTPGSDADGEVMLDIEVAGAVAPGAQIAVYFAPNTDQGFSDAIAQAVHDTARNPSVLSISWGGPEESWSQQALNAMTAALEDAASLGVTVTVAAGDNGSSDGVNDGKAHVDFPASSVYSLACGGTKAQVISGTLTEQVWNETASKEGATGGGVSNIFPIPGYQSAAKVPKQVNTKFAGRGVPDVAGDADPETGYNVIVDGQPQVIGGTSAVAPLWAGLIALLNQQLGKNLGYCNAALYAINPPVLNDITTGTNGAYSAGPGWDACTGLGTPNGVALVSALSAAAANKAT